MAFWDIMGGVGAIGGAVTDAVVGAANLKFQSDNLDYMKWAQNETWNREDTAVQRRMADLVKAGLNPMLAAGGQGSPVSSPIRTEAPQLQIDPARKLFEGASAAMMLQKAKTDISNTEAQTRLIDMQTKKAALDSSFLESSLQDRLSSTYSRSLSDNIKVDSDYTAAQLAKMMAGPQFEGALIRNTGADLDNQLKRMKLTAESLNIDEQKLDILIKQVASKLAPLKAVQSWSLGEKEIATKQIILDILQSDRTIKGKQADDSGFNSALSKIKGVLGVAGDLRDLFSK